MSLFPESIGNRESLIIKLEECIISHKDQSKRFALLLININHFRRFNINQGYQIADTLLTAFSSRLAELSRDQDYIARIGNSEFAMILPEVHNEGHASLAAIKLIGSLNEPFNLDNVKIRATADIGIVVFPDHAEDIKNLFRNAELALSDARESNQSFAVYSSQLKTPDANYWNLESELQDAIDKDQFELYFQPQVSLDSREIFGAEALIRWKNGDKGFIRPDIFIPVAEQSGQIYEITEWTINSALWLITSWPQTAKPLKVAVNISTKMLKEPGFVEFVTSAVRIHSVEYDRLTLEITESALVEDMSASFNILDEFKSLGINISIDDFGTGYSSMAYFKNIPANELKIDQSFISYMLENQMDQHIVKTVIQMAKGFDLTVVAEGIEDQETFDALNRLGCDIAQGYHLAKPMPQEEFLTWLNNYSVE
jgi:diguanylate cyclase (GGDEF)-like protein